MWQTTKKIIPSLTAGAVLIALPLVAFAAAPTPSAWLMRILNNFLNMILWPLLLGLVIIMLVWAGILFVTANGDPGKIGSARQAVIYAIVGLVVGMLAFSMVAIVRNVLNVT